MEWVRGRPVIGMAMIAGRHPMDKVMVGLRIC